MTTQKELRRWRRGHPSGAVSFVLSPGGLALALMVKYAILIAYALTSIAILVPSFVAVGGFAFAMGWACSILIFAGCALAATLRTWYTGKFNTEIAAIAGLVIMFLAYSIVLIVRGALLGSWGGISVGWLPLALSVLPMIRYYSLVVLRGRQRGKTKDNGLGI